MMHKNLSGNWPSSEKYISGKKLPDNQQVHIPVLQDNYLLYGTTGYGKTTLTKITSRLCADNANEILMIDYGRQKCFFVLHCQYSRIIQIDIGL